jgi:ankyrin repeat protein
MTESKSQFYDLYKDANQDSINRSFSRVCSKDTVERIKYLLTSNELKYNAQINYDKENAIKAACSNGNLELVKYLLASPELQEHANHDTALRSAANYGKIDILRYLLDQNNFQINNFDEKLENLFANAYVFKEQKTMMFLIIEMNIKRSNKIDKLLKNSMNEALNEKIIKIFERQELANSLNQSLSSNNSTIKKNKI